MAEDSPWRRTPKARMPSCESFHGAEYRIPSAAPQLRRHPGLSDSGFDAFASRRNDGR